MIAVDTNILVYAFRTDSSLHGASRDFLESLATGPTPWAITTQVIAEFLRVTTFPRQGAAEPALARSFLDALLASPSLRVLSPGERHWSALRTILEEAGSRGNDVHDAAIVATCFEHGVDTIVSEDRGFGRYDHIARLGLEQAGTARERSPRYRATRKRASATMRAR